MSDAFEVSANGSIVGPVSLDQIRRGVQQGRIPPDAAARPVGTTAWLPVSHLLAQPARPKARGGKGAVRKLIFAGVGLGVVAVAGVILGLTLRHKGRALPVLASKLPPKTTAIQQFRIDADDDANTLLPEEFVASKLASFCGGTDVASVLAKSRGKSLTALKELGAFEAFSSSASQSGLKCGDSIRKSLIDSSAAAIAFDDGDAHLVVIGLQSKLAQPTDIGFERHTFSGLEGGCLRSKDAKVECPDDAQAALHEGQAWFFGKTSAIEAFARSYMTAHSELTTNVDSLNSTIAETDPADDIRLAAKPDAIPWLKVCAEAAPSESLIKFAEACFPKGEDRVQGAIVAKVRGLAVESDVIAHAVNYRTTFVLVARDADEAKELEKDVNDLARDWRAQIENGQPDMDKLVRAKSGLVHDDFVRAAFDPFVRAMKAMEVSRSGPTVRLAISTPLRPEEKKSLGEFLETRDDDQRTTSHVIRALEEGKAASEADLAKFLDPTIVRWLVMPKATAADCRVIREHGKAISQNVPVEQFGTKYKEEKRFEDATCIGVGLTASSRQCLIGAPDLKTFADCTVVPSAAVAVAAAKVEGQWILLDADNTGDADLVGAKLEVG
jgi:hypothetical protein